MAHEVRIAVVDDDRLVRLGLRELIEAHDGWKVVAEGADGDSAMQIARQFEPDILLIDWFHPGPNGLEVSRWMMKNAPDVRVIMVTMARSTALVREILEAGGRGLIVKTDLPDELIRGIDTVLEGKLFFSKSISEILRNDFEAKPVPTEGPLTSREIAIISLLARGKSNKEVATELKLSLRVTETNRANIMTKLQAHSIQDLVRYAVRNRLVDL